MGSLNSTCNGMLKRRTQLGAVAVVMGVLFMLFESEMRLTSFSEGTAAARFSGTQLFHNTNGPAFVELRTASRDELSSFAMDPPSADKPEPSNNDVAQKSSRALDYEEAKHMFRENLQHAGPLAVLTPKHPKLPLPPVTTPQCKPITPSVGVFMHLPKEYDGRFDEAIWDRKIMLKYGLFRATNAVANISIFGLTRKMPEAETAIRSGKKVVLLVKTDDVTRGSEYEYMEHENFLGILKEFVYRNLGDYLEPRWFGRALSFHICDSPTFRNHPSCGFTNRTANQTMITVHKFRPAWSKVRSVSWNWKQYYPLMPYRTAKPVDIFKYYRNLDVFMAVHLRDEPGSAARAQVVLALRTYTGPKDLMQLGLHFW